METHVKARDNVKPDSRPSMFASVNPDARDTPEQRKVFDGVCKLLVVLKTVLDDIPIRFGRGKPAIKNDIQGRLVEVVWHKAIPGPRKRGLAFRCVYAGQRYDCHIEVIRAMLVRYVEKRKAHNPKRKPVSTCINTTSDLEVFIGGQWEKLGSLIPAYVRELNFDHLNFSKWEAEFVKNYVRPHQRSNPLSLKQSAQSFRAAVRIHPTRFKRKKSVQKRHRRSKRPQRWMNDGKQQDKHEKSSSEILPPLHRDQHEPQQPMIMEDCAFEQASADFYTYLARRRTSNFENLLFFE